MDHKGYFQAKMHLSYPSGGEGVGGAQLIKYLQAAPFIHTHRAGRESVCERGREQ